MKILVTGAGGMVGSHLVEHLFLQGGVAEILGTYYKPTTDISEINSQINMQECDVRDYQSVLKIVSQFMPDRIFHLAAQSYPTVLRSEPKIAKQIFEKGEHK